LLEKTSKTKSIPHHAPRLKLFVLCLAPPDTPVLIERVHLYCGSGD
jgi:hypothetical protein